MLLRWPDFEEMSQHKTEVQWGQLMDCPFGFTGQEVLGEPDAVVSTQRLPCDFLAFYSDRVFLPIHIIIYCRYYISICLYNRGKQKPYIIKCNKHINE